ncbi:IclR family transcriptional regulator C-terminal domain-containing protein, partial [Salmonella enterica]|uniref:IclR family transcriptional regulator C-terminal domain-containing protein n=1 Tax=Salmonella enterica TaxID=28901 RepID=UPI0032971677
LYSQIGNTAPVYCTGVGKAALSPLPHDELQARIAQIAFQRFTPSTLPDAKALRREIEQIRAEGNGYDREE